MEINQAAPVFALKEIIIDAPVSKVWQTQANIEEWPQWQPNITSVKMNGGLQPGSTFHWKAQGMTIHSRLHTVESETRIGWTGNSLGMYAIHNWMFEEHGEKTRAITEESLSGWLTRLMKLFDPHFLDKSMETALQRLKARAEENRP